VALVTLLVGTPGCLHRRPAASAFTTGDTDAAFAGFDAAMGRFMQQAGIPGGALAVFKQGRLLYARGYGWVDVAGRVPVQPTSLFRIASVSKPITSAAIFTLVQEGRLDLDARAFRLLNLRPALKQGNRVDPRLWQITVRQLLEHTAGFDSNESVEPMIDNDELPSTTIAAAVGVRSPPGPGAIVRYMMGRPLDFEPGTRYAYSNFGYCVLGRVIEKVSGQSYERYVRSRVLAPLGITRMRLGRTRLRDRAPGEVRYYDLQEPPVPSVFPEDRGKKVPWPYGGFYLEAMDAHGGWLASAVDLARFAAALDYPPGKPLLTSASLRVMQARPGPPVNWESEDSSGRYFYACGWEARQDGRVGRITYFHSGYLNGEYALLVRRADGSGWAALFNGGPGDGDPKPLLDAAADAVTGWPARDEFPRYLGSAAHAAHGSARR
jgi:N-acyl-D-amino-acid deacylase